MASQSMNLHTTLCPDALRMSVLLTQMQIYVQNVFHYCRSVADRYKYVVTASIGNIPPTHPGSLVVGSRCLWNGVTDRYSTTTYVDDDETFYAVAVVFAVYFE